MSQNEHIHQASDEFWIKQQVLLALTMAMHLLDESLDDTVLLVVW